MKSFKKLFERYHCRRKTPTPAHPQCDDDVLPLPEPGHPIKLSKNSEDNKEPECSGEAMGKHHDTKHDPGRTRIPEYSFITDRLFKKQTLTGVVPRLSLRDFRIDHPDVKCSQFVRKRQTIGSLNRGGHLNLNAEPCLIDYCDDLDLLHQND